MKFVRLAICRVVLSDVVNVQYATLPELVVLIASYSKQNKTIDPDDAIGYADWTANSEVLIVLDELLEFINKSKEGVDDE